MLIIQVVSSRPQVSSTFYFVSQCSCPLTCFAELLDFLSTISSVLVQTYLPIRNMWIKIVISIPVSSVILALFCLEAMTNAHLCFLPVSLFVK